MKDRRAEDYKFIKRIFYNALYPGGSDIFDKEHELTGKIQQLQEDAVTEILKEQEEEEEEQFDSRNVPDGYVSFRDNKEVMAILDKAIGDKSSPIAKHIFGPLSQQFLGSQVDGGLFGSQEIMGMCFLKLMIFLALPTIPANTNDCDYAHYFASVQQQAKSFYYKRMIRELALIYDPKEQNKGIREFADNSASPLSLTRPLLPADFQCFMNPKSALARYHLTNTEDQIDVAFGYLNQLKGEGGKKETCVVSETTSEALAKEGLSVSVLVQHIRNKEQEELTDDQKFMAGLVKDTFAEEVVDIIDTYIETRLDYLFRNKSSTHPQFALSFEKRIKKIITVDMDESTFYMDQIIISLCRKIAPWIFYIRSVLRGQPEFILIPELKLDPFPLTKMFALEFIHTMCQAK